MFTCIESILKNDLVIHGKALVPLDLTCLAEWAFIKSLHEKDVAARARVVARRWRGRFNRWPSRIHRLQFPGESPLNLCCPSLNVFNAVGEGSAATALYCIAGTHGVEVTAEPLAPPVISVPLDIVHPILARRVSWVTIISLVVLKTGISKTMLPPLLMLLLNRTEFVPYITLLLAVFPLLAVIVQDQLHVADRVDFVKSSHCIHLHQVQGLGFRFQSILKKWVFVFLIH